MKEKALAKFEEIITCFNDSQKGILLNIISSLIANPNIDGIMIGGSVADSTNDEFSDLDIKVATVTENSEEVEIERIMVLAKSIPTFTEYSIAFRLPFFGDLITLFFENLEFSVDIGFFSPNRLRNTQLEPYGIILFDDSGSLSINRDNIHISTLTRSYEEEIWISLMKVNKALLRGNLWRAHEYLARSRRATLGLTLKQLGRKIRYEGREDHNIEKTYDTSHFSKTWPSNGLHSLSASSIALIELTYSLDIPPRIQKTLDSLVNKFRYHLSCTNH
ncbi:MAG: hypothetical protein JWO03_1699 [Bacteroidetes bacterium]|nr:hypothetical protein [Bacteroidota bacterium]